MQMTNHSGQILPDALDHSHFCEDTQDTLDVEEESNPKFLELLMAIDDYTMTTNMKLLSLKNYHAIWILTRSSITVETNLKVRWVNFPQKIPPRVFY